MAITTWAQFLQQLTRLLDGEKTGTTTIAPLTLAQIISLGERRIYREVRSRWNEAEYTDVLASNNLAAIPSDFEAPSVTHLGYSALEPVSEEFLLDQLATNCVSQTRYFTVAGSYFQFAGAVSDGTILKGRYFCRLPDLSATTLPDNDLFLNEPDLFIFACLSQAAPFFDQDARLPLWEGRYASLRDTLNERHSRSAYSTGRLMRRPSAGGYRVLPRFGASVSVVGDYAQDYVDDYA